MIRIDTAWFAVEPLDMRAQGRVVFARPDDRPSRPSIGRQCECRGSYIKWFLGEGQSAYGCEVQPPCRKRRRYDNRSCTDGVIEPDPDRFETTWRDAPARGRLFREIIAEGQDAMRGTAADELQELSQTTADVAQRGHRCGTEGLQLGRR